ncbi:hypothetical protein [Dapis sp. BLCC M229]|uniref:hypothetical protein n=1 Tax=Dapis sp. BLCC M229 TaxID=3400188 RepID=UPI003CEFD8DE
MTRRQNTLKASESECQQIKQRIKELNWKRGENSQALVEASKNLIFDTIITGYEITLEKLEELIDEEAVYIPKTQKSEYRQFKQKIKKSANQIISSFQLEELIESDIILAKNVSYRTWSNFQKGIPIDKSAFVAYWKTLGFETEIIQELGTKKNSSDFHNRSTLLYRILLSVNHRPQINIFQNLAKHKRRVGGFFIQGNCHYCRAWLMRRIEIEIIKYGAAEVKKLSFDLASDLTEFSIPTIWMKLGAELQLTSADFIQKKHIILVFKNVETLDKKRLEELLEQFWFPLVKQIPAGKNFLIMFLEDCGGQNDWRDNTEIFPQVIKMPIAESISETDIREAINQIEIILQAPLPSINDAIGDLLKYSKNGKSRLVLEYMYKLFQCQFSRETRWQTYP